VIRILTNIRSLYSCPESGGQSEVGRIDRAALAWGKEGIVWAGPEAEIPPHFSISEVVDAHGAVVIPGLVDCHTHLAFAGWRADEFEQRCLGTDYRQIAANGGGILRTVRMTREASENDLFERAGRFLDQMIALGTTTVECKSGYGLTIEDELKLLRVYKRLAEARPVRLMATFLGAHAIPPEFRDDRSGYIRLVCDEMIPRVAAEKLAAFCDVFIEDGAFTVAEARAIFAAARAHGLRPKLHADQLTNGGGANLAAEVGAISADHLECADDAGLKAMAKSGVIAVALPLASLFLNRPRLDARRCLAAGVSVAVATDFNPGSAPSFHLPLAQTLACTMNHLTPLQALKGATIIAAQALGLEREVGSLEAGKRADFVLLDAEDVGHWLYHFRPSAVRAVYINGERHDP
jgi:imidazolonepropionase